jgi:hypothetical protein
VALAWSERHSRSRLLSGISVFLTLFLVVNPGIFFVQMGPLAAPFLLAFAYLFLGAANGGYLAMFRERWRTKFRANRSKGRSERRPQAFDSTGDQPLKCGSTRVCIEKSLQIRWHWHGAKGAHVRTSRVSFRNPDTREQAGAEDTGELAEDFA